MIFVLSFLRASPFYTIAADSLKLVTDTILLCVIMRFPRPSSYGLFYVLSFKHSLFCYFVEFFARAPNFISKGPAASSLEFTGGKSTELY